MSVWKFIGASLVIGGGILAAREALLTVRKRQNEKALFLQASIRAHERGKELLVIGDPDAGFLSHFIGGSFGCGDMVIDAYGAPKCPTYMAGPVLDLLNQVAAGRFVVFAANLESVRSDMNQVLSQLDRISDGDLFIAHLNPTSLTAWLNPNGQRRILSAPPESPVVKFRPLPWHSIPGTTEVWAMLPKTQERLATLGIGAEVAPPAPTSFIDTEGSAA